MEPQGGKTRLAPPPSADRLQVVLALSGVVGPVLFAIVVAVLAALRPGYSHVADIISALGAVGTPNAILQNISSMVTGVLLVAFSVGLHRGIGGGKGSKAGPALVAVAGGAGLVGIGIFPLDLGDPSAFTNSMHGLLALVAIAPLVAAPFFLSPRLRKEGAWEGLASYSFVTGLVLAVAFALATMVGITLGEESGFIGAMQRLVFGVPLLWVVVLAARLLRLSLSSGSRSR